MIKVWADVKHNRLNIVLHGFIKQDEAKDIVFKTKKEIQKLQCGFSVVSDISTFCYDSQLEPKSLVRIHKLLKQHGVCKIIRVKGQSVIANWVFDEISRSSGMVVQKVESRGDAETLLLN